MYGHTTEAMMCPALVEDLMVGTTILEYITGANRTVQSWAR
jgi:hypothetical protein